MGEVITFQPKHIRQAQSELSTKRREFESRGCARVAAGCTIRDILDLAGPLLADCRDRYGFTLMADGLPEEPARLVAAIVGLADGLCLLTVDIKRRPPITFGVYFGGNEFAWFEDGYGDDTGLEVPDTVDPLAFAAIVRARLKREVWG